MKKLLFFLAAVFLVLPQALPARETGSPVQGFDLAGTWLIKQDKAQVRVTHAGQEFRFEKTYFHRGNKFVKAGRFKVNGARVVFTYDDGTRAAGKLDMLPRMVESSTRVWEKLTSDTVIPDVDIQGTWKVFGNEVIFRQQGTHVLGEKYVGGQRYSRFQGQVAGRLVSLKETYDTIATSNPPFHSLLYRDPGCLIQSTTANGQDTCWTRANP